MKDSASRAPKDHETATQEIPVESSTRPGVVYRVDIENRSCSCPATVEVCRHRRIALIRRRKRLRRLEQQYRHEMMEDGGRQELLDTIRRLRRAFYR